MKKRINSGTNAWLKAWPKPHQYPDNGRIYAETVEVDGIPVKTINLEGLLRTKQTVRDKDVADRIILERALEIYHRERVVTPNKQGQEK